MTTNNVIASETKQSNPASIRQAFGEAIFELAKINKNIYVVDADLNPSLHLHKFAQKFPKRLIQCGVAEANAAAVAAGLAKSGKTIFLTSFACFSPAINWAVIKQSICYNNSNVKIIGSHAGLLSGDLGATHQMLEDVALMRSLPNMEVFSPLDAIECKKIVQTISRSPYPSYLRLVRPDTSAVYNTKLPFTIGKSQVLHKGSDITLLGYGPILANFFSVWTGLDRSASLEIINLSSIKPLDTDTVLKSVKKTGRCLVVEDHQKNGGVGEAVASLILSSGIKCRFIHLGIDNQFGQSSKDTTQLYDLYGIGLQDIQKSIEKLMK